MKAKDFIALVEVSRRGVRRKIKQKSSKKADPGDIERLFDAVEAGNFQRVKNYLDKGVPVDSVGKTGDTPLIWAAQEDIRLVKYLLRKGANPNAQGKQGWTALMVACQYQLRDIIEVLLDNGADVGIPSSDGRTALDIAYTGTKKSKELVRLLKKYTKGK